VALVLPALATPVLATGAPENPDPDVLLDGVVQDLAANRLRAAMAKADALVRLYPNFQLGHLVRGDLLLMHNQVVDRLGAVAGMAPRELKDLRAEAAARFRARRERPDPSLVPRPVLQLRDDQKQVLVVDARRSRLYVYDNRDGDLQLADDYYISQGILGVDKQREGDRKTPLGVYYITGRLAGTRLTDFYGPLALPISYPNEWDKLHGRGGSGIWLHGTPADSFSRPPLSSDGCVVLSNRDLDRLAVSVQIGKTPLVIGDGVEFVSRAEAQAGRALARALVEGWRQDFESTAREGLRAHYSARFSSARGERLDAWLERQRRAAGGMRDLSLFFYPGQEELIVATFTLDGPPGDGRRPVRRRQYWAKEDTQWKIVSESSWLS
jgi:hypothetical protein